MKGVDYLTIDILVNITYNKVHKLNFNGMTIVQGFATDETDEGILFPNLLAFKLAKKFSEVRKENRMFFLLHQSAKFIVTIEYSKSEKKNLQTIVKSIILLVYTEKEKLSEEQIKKNLFLYVIKKVVREEYLDPKFVFIVNFKEKKEINCYNFFGMSGRKDFNFPYFTPLYNGKDLLNKDKGGTLAARWVAKSLVFNNLCKKVCVQLTYDDDSLVNIRINPFNTSPVSEKELIEIVNKNFNLSFENITSEFQLRRPINKAIHLDGFFESNHHFLWENPLKFI